MPTEEQLASIEARVSAATQAAEQSRATNAQLAVNATQRQAELDRIATLESQLDGEQRDVHELESLTWTALIARARGTREGSLEREGAERDAISKQLDAARTRLDVADRERRTLEERLVTLGRIAADRDQALDDLDRLKAADGDPVASARVAAADELGKVRAERTQVDEAIAAAHRAQHALAAVSDRLSSAHGWSTYDTWFGGGAIASAIKHDRLDEAAHATASAGAALRDLQRELADVPSVGQLTATLASAHDRRTFDIWFDNIFTDVKVGQRISDAEQAARQVTQQINALLDTLTARSSSLAARAQELDATNAQ